ncbi:MAG: hypothetical protein K0R89_1727 [Ramlibacter sp.]|nr:hypothetical protein [Ramlibacter sp.]
MRRQAGASKTGVRCAQRPSNALGPLKIGFDDPTDSDGAARRQPPRRDRHVGGHGQLRGQRRHRESRQRIAAFRAIDLPARRVRHRAAAGDRRRHGLAAGGAAPARSPRGAASLPRLLRHPHLPHLAVPPADRQRDCHQHGDAAVHHAVRGDRVPREGGRGSLAGHPYRLHGRAAGGAAQRRRLQCLCLALSGRHAAARQPGPDDAHHRPQHPVAARHAEHRHRRDDPVRPLEPAAGVAAGEWPGPRAAGGSQRLPERRLLPADDRHALRRDERDRALPLRGAVVRAAARLRRVGGRAERAGLGGHRLAGGRRAVRAARRAQPEVHHPAAWPWCSSHASASCAGVQPASRASAL